MKNEIILEDISQLMSKHNVINWSKLKNSHLLVTGGSGMLGIYIVYVIKYLNDTLHYNTNVTIVVRNKDKTEKIFKSILNLDFFNIFVTDLSESNFDMIGEYDYIIHNASQASPNYFSSDPVGTIKCNTIGTFNLLDYAVLNKVKNFLFVSSLEVYGPTDEGKYFNETEWGTVNTLDFRSCYSEGKRAAETILVSYAKQYDINVKIMRLGFTFGPGMSINDTRVQAYFMKCLLNEDNIVLKSRGTQLRNYTYVSDAVAALFYILLNGHSIAYNVESKQNRISIYDLAKKTLEFNSDANLEVCFELDNDSNNIGWSKINNTGIDTKKIEELGWKGLTSIHDGLDRWYQYLIINECNME